LDIFEQLILQLTNGDKWNPIYGESQKYQNYLAILDLHTCLYCRKTHGKIITDDMMVYEYPPIHQRCRCYIEAIKTIKAGTATIKGENGADYCLKNEGKLPNYYLSWSDAEKLGYRQYLGNLDLVAPGKSIARGEYKNHNGHLPQKLGRKWYEADINYQFGYRNSQRVIYSNDGLIFVTYDHYTTFLEVI